MDLKDNEYFTKLEKYDNQTLMTKELKELGISKYQLSKLNEMGVLKRERRGCYKINITHFLDLENETKINDLILKLNEELKQDNYNEAYNIFKSICELPHNRSFDSFLALCKDLFNFILGVNDSIVTIKTINSKLNERSDFEIAIINRKYLEAKKLMSPIKDSPKVMDQVLYNLVNKACKISSLKNKNLVRKTSFSNNYQKFIENIRNRNHKRALEYLRVCILSCDEEVLPILKMMEELVSLTINYLDNKKIDLKVRDNYESIENPASELEKAIYSHDLFYALHIISTNDLIKNKMYKSLKYMIFGYLKLTKKYDEYCTYHQHLLKSQPAPNRGNILNALDPNAEKKKINNHYRATYLYQMKFNNYEAVFSALSKISDKTKNEVLLVELLSFYIQMKTNKSGFTIYDINYQSTTTEELFYKALEKKDYKTALRNIGKLTYKNTNQELEFMKSILHEMNELDKLSQAKKTYVPYTMDKLLNSLAKSDFKSVLANLKLGEQKGLLNGFEKNVCSLIEIILDLKAGKLEEKVETYNFDSKHRRMFLEAIKNKPLPEIIYYYEILYSCSEKTEKLAIYELLVTEIKKYKKELAEQMKAKAEAAIIREKNESRLAKINNAIKYLINGELTDEKMGDLYNLLEEKRQYAPLEADLELDILSTIYELQTSPLKSYSSSDKSNIENNDEYIRILTLFENRDYLAISKVLKFVPKNELFKKHSEEDQYIIYRLFEILSYTFNKHLLINPTSDNTRTLENEEIKSIRSRIKKYDFVGALDLLLESKHIRKEIVSEFASAILSQIIVSKDMEKGIREDFGEAILKGDRETARRLILEYEEVLKFSSFGRIDSYKEQHKNMSRIYTSQK